MPSVYISIVDCDSCRNIPQKFSREREGGEVAQGIPPEFNGLKKEGHIQKKLKLVVDIFPEIYPRDLIKPSWRPLVQDGDGSVVDSKFCGLPYLAPGEEWPLCGTCGKPMHFIMQINFSQVPEETRISNGDCLLQMWYCVRECNFDASNRLDPTARSNLVRITLLVGEAPSVNAPDCGASQVIGGTFPAKRIVGWEKQREEFLDISQWDSLLPADLREKIYEIIDFNLDPVKNWMNPEKGDKLGGWARLHERNAVPKCPFCASEMQLIFQIQSEDNLPYLWRPRFPNGTSLGRPRTTAHISKGTGYITQCQIHRDQVTFTWDYSSF